MTAQLGTLCGNLVFRKAYRFGFNGQEKDDEIFNSTGSSYTAEFWQYDSRIGRRWNIDPVMKPWESSYAAFNNNPIYYSDPLGLEGEEPPKGYKDNGDGTATKTNDDGSSWTMIKNEKGEWIEGGGDMGTLPEVTISAEGPKKVENTKGGEGFNIIVNGKSYRFSPKGDPLYIPYQSVANYNYWNNNKEKFINDNGETAAFSDVFMSEEEWWGEVLVDIGIEWAGGEYKKDGNEMTTHPVNKYEKWRWHFPARNKKEAILKKIRAESIRDMILLQSVPVMFRSTEDDTYLKFLEEKYGKQK